mmetsp:Transcript_118419/g.209301  ORF Transcript_118419/g.209301 Transcript_118419/m.209301 type:complete len:646 (-) Transcript_118419:69-2006(-)
MPWHPDPQNCFLNSTKDVGIFMETCDYVYPGSSLFVDPDAMTTMQLIWAFCSYGYVLFVSANMIGDGAELLLFVPQYAGLVGSIIIPILGAVPDGMMVFFSGMGKPSVAQYEVAVGVGALAGSTIMLLTLPWVISIFAGRVDMSEDGELVGYKKKAGEKVTQGLMQTGVQFQDGVRNNAKLMALTSLGYLWIQIPALRYDDQTIYESAKDVFMDEVRREARVEQPFAYIGLVFSVSLFLGYLFLQYIAGRQSEAPPEVAVAEPAVDRGIEIGTPYVVDAPMGKTPTTTSVNMPYFQSWLPAPQRAQAGFLDNPQVEEYGLGLAILNYQEGEKRRQEAFSHYAANAPLVKSGAPLPQHITQMITSMFSKYACLSHPPNEIAYTDMCTLVRKLGIYATDEDIKYMYEKVDTDHSQSLDKKEFFQFFYLLIAVKRNRRATAVPMMDKMMKVPEKTDDAVAASEEGDDDDDEEEELPEEFQNLPEDEQKRKITMEAFKQMGLGTLLVLLFTDPMVDVLSKIGKVVHISPFFISFVLAPIASNASELFAAARLASKKTSKTITIGFQTLEGAACMNNTFCLAIFYALIIKQGLAWKFTAETGVIVLVQIIMCAIVLVSHVQTVMTAILIFMLYPLSLAFVAIMNGGMHID